jgi:hypothetical protein
MPSFGYQREKGIKGNHSIDGAPWYIESASHIFLEFYRDISEGFLALLEYGNETSRFLSNAFNDGIHPV